MVAEKTTALEGQTLADLTLQETGSVAGLFELAMANGKSITDLPAPGERLTIPLCPSGIFPEGGNCMVMDKAVADYYRAHGIRPVSRIGVVEDNETLFDAGLFDAGLFD